MALHLPDILSSFPLSNPTAIFLSVLAIIFFVPLIFNRLKIPYIIGLIAAGMAVGPHGFNLLARDASFEIFGEVGILYLMFLAGVEIDMYHLRRNYRKGIVFGLLTFAIPMAAGIPGCHWLLGTAWTPSVLIATMFASHTLLTYPVITKFGLSNSKAAVIAVSGTIIAVLLALIVLAEVVQIRVDGGFSIYEAGWLTLKLTVYVALFGLVTPWVSRRFFRKFNNTVTQFVYVLGTVFLFAVTAQFIGVASILGAFYAGLVLNRFIPSRSGLMGNINFTGNAIFIPYFLIGVGMLINVQVIVEGWTVWWTAMVMTVLALGSKWLAAYMSQKILGLNGLQRKIIFGLSAGKAAATIAATMIGYQYGLLNEDVLNGAVLMILICSIVASIATQQGAVKLRMKWTSKELNSEENYHFRPGRQLVAVGNPVTSEGLMKMAGLTHGKDEKEHETVLLFIRNSDDPMYEAMGKEALRTASEAATRMDLPTHEVIRYDMSVVSGMVNVMKEYDCDELIIGLHRQQAGFDSFYGSMEEKLLRATNKMIVLSRCYIPINTIHRMFIYVPPKAEYETGFHSWVYRLGNLAMQLGCATEIMACEETQRYISEALAQQKQYFDVEYLKMESWDDFIILSSRISEEDLLAVVSARRMSISYGQEVETMPSFLNKYFKRVNLLMILPEQFGAEQSMPAPNDVLAHSL